MASSSSRSSAGGSGSSAKLTLSPWACKALAGTGSGIIATALCSPLDVAKTRIQVQTSKAAASSQYSGVFGALLTIYRQEGLAGWYQGFTPAVCSVAIFWTVYFPCYDYGKEQIGTLSGLSQASPLVHMTAAASAGLVTDVITNPFWVVRTRLATQALRNDGSSERYTSMRHAFSRIGVEEGPMAFFAGLSASILGLSHIMIQFPLYERIKADLVSYSNSSSGGGGISGSSRSSSSSSSSGGAGTGSPSGGSTDAAKAAAVPMWHVITASGLSKLVASTITYPHEVIRARLQNDQGGRAYAGLVDATAKTYRQEGLGAFWLGFRLNIVRTIPQSIVTFTMYEHLSNLLQTWVRKGPSRSALQEHRHAQRSNPDGTQPPGNGVHVERIPSVHEIARTRSESRG